MLFLNLALVCSISYLVFRRSCVQIPADVSENACIYCIAGNFNEMEIFAILRIGIIKSCEIFLVRVRDVSILSYFNRAGLPDPKGPLSKEVPVSIMVANEEILKVITNAKTIL